MLRIAPATIDRRLKGGPGKTRSPGPVPHQAGNTVFAAIKDATAEFPFPILGIDSDNVWEFIDWELLTWGEQENLTFTRSGNKNDGALNPAAIQRQIQALSAELLTLTTAKQAPNPSPPSGQTK